MQAHDQGQQAIPAMPNPFRFPCSQPSPLLFIESGEQQVELPMQRFVGMVSRLQTIRTWTLVNGGREHFPVSS
jgi:hypothetical protein